MSVTLVTGGAGYIGSHTCVELLLAGRDVVVVDDLSNASPEALRRVEKLGGRALKAFVHGDVRDRALMAGVFAEHAISVLPESAVRPGMRILGPSEGFATLPSCKIGLLRTRFDPSVLSNALAEHIIQSLDNLASFKTAAE